MLHYIHMNTQKGSTLGIIILSLGILGLALYVILAPQNPDITPFDVDEEGEITADDTSNVDQEDVIDEFLNQDIAFDQIPESELTPESFPNVQQFCLDVRTPQPGAIITLPFIVEGEILDSDCWQQNGNSVGSVFIERNGQMHAGTQSEIILLESTTEEEVYPRTFTATIPNPPQRITGDVDIIFSAPSQEEASASFGQRLRIPVVVE